MDWSWRSPLKELANSKPLFLTIYAAVILGVIFSSFYVFFAIYSSKPTDAVSASPTVSAFHFFSYSNSSPINQTSHSHPDAAEVTPMPSSHSPAAGLRNVWEVPSDTVMPPLSSFHLTKSLIQERVKDNIIIVTFGNYAFMDFILTWVKHLTNLGLFNILVGAMDTQLLEALYWRGVPVFDMGSHMSTLDVGWGTPTFHKMGREKVILINAILPFGYELLMCDTDMVWLKDPLPYFARYAEADVLISTDQVVPTVVDDSLDLWPQVGAAYNIGIFHWRPTSSAMKLAKEWKDMLVSDEKIWDQNGFNELVRRQLGPSVDESGLVYAFDGNLKLGLLPASIFCSGHTFFVQDMHYQLKLDPYAIHTTFQYAGTEGKRHRLREALVFYDPPEYYDVPGGFLSFKPSTPKSLLLDGMHNIKSHFSLVNYQLKEIRTALAISSLLNRTLVMPPIWCRLDRLWYPHPGVLTGSMTRQPFLCPLDHVFKVDTMLKKLPEEEFGPGINFREYSFLRNPSFPRKAVESKLEVLLCALGSRDCHVTNKTSSEGVLRFPKHSSEEVLKSVFANFKDVKVIEFSSMQNAFSGFSQKIVEERFRKRVKRYVDIWCCVENHVPGHIYYDMYWDEKPDWKPLPPQSREDDHPPR